MMQGIATMGVYVRDQDEALAFYVDKLGFQVHTDARNGDYRWLTVQHPAQHGFQLGLFLPGPPIHDAATAQALREAVAKGAMPPLVLARTIAAPRMHACATPALSSLRSRWRATARWTRGSAIRPATAGS